MLRLCECIPGCERTRVSANVSVYAFIYRVANACIFITIYPDRSFFFFTEPCCVRISNEKEFYQIGVILNVDGVKSRLYVRRRSCVYPLNVNYNISAHCEKPCVILNV